MFRFGTASHFYEVETSHSTSDSGFCVCNPKPGTIISPQHQDWNDRLLFQVKLETRNPHCKIRNLKPERGDPERLMGSPLTLAQGAGFSGEDLRGLMDRVSGKAFGFAFRNSKPETRKKRPWTSTPIDISSGSSLIPTPQFPNQVL